MKILFYFKVFDQTSWPEISLRILDYINLGADND